MPQWDVYANPSARSRGDLPYLVDLQSDLLTLLGTRLMAPLARTRIPLKGLPPRLCPLFNVGGEDLLLLANEAGPVDARHLKQAVASLRDRAHVVIDALDAVVSGI